MTTTKPRNVEFCKLSYKVGQHAGWANASCLNSIVFTYLNGISLLFKPSEPEMQSKILLPSWGGGSEEPLGSGV